MFSRVILVSTISEVIKSSEVRLGTQQHSGGNVLKTSSGNAQRGPGRVPGPNPSSVESCSFDQKTNSLDVFARDSMAWYRTSGYLRVWWRLAPDTIWASIKTLAQSLMARMSGFRKPIAVKYGLSYSICHRERLREQIASCLRVQREWMNEWNVTFSIYIYIKKIITIFFINIFQKYIK